MGEIAMELARVGFRTPTVFRAGWTPARERLRATSIKVAESTSSAVESAAAIVQPEVLAVQTPLEKVQQYLGFLAKPGTGGLKVNKWHW